MSKELIELKKQVNYKISKKKELEYKIKSIEELIEKENRQLGLIWWWVFIKDFGRNEKETKNYTDIKTLDDLLNNIFEK